MRLSLPARSKTLALTGIAFLIVGLFLSPSSLAGSASALAPLPHEALSASVAAPVGHPSAGVTWQNTSVITTDRTAGSNVALNWSLRTNIPTLTGPIDISTAGQNLSMTAGEKVGRFYSARVGFDAFPICNPTCSQTVIQPVADLNGTTYLDTSVVLPNPGNLIFRMVHTGGDWWTFSANSNLIIVDGGNGTYNLTAPSARSFGASSISLNVSESGPSLPINNNEFFAAATPALEVNTTRAPTVGYIPATGVYIADNALPADSVPMFGEDQIPGVSPISFPGGELAINPSGTISGFVPPTTTNGTLLWGVNPTAPGQTKAWLGAYIQDATDQNITGARLVTEVPAANVLPPEGQTIANQVIVPINGTLNLGIELIDANISFTFNGTTYSEVGSFPVVTIYNETDIFGEWAADTPQTPSAMLTISVQRSAGWWWTITEDGTPVTGWIDGNDAAFNGTFLMNASTMWGYTQTPFWALPTGQAELSGVNVPFLSTDQPMLAFFGNHTNYWINSSILLQNSGGWGTPLRGFAYTYAPQDDLLLASDQHGSLLPGTVLVANGTTALPAFGFTKPLTNGTALWTATLIKVLASTYTIESGSTSSSGGTTSLIITVTYGGVGEAHETLVGCTDTLALGSCVTFAPNPNFAGTYYDNFTATSTVTTPQLDTISLLMVNGLTGLAAVGTFQLNITAPVLLAGVISGYGSSGKFTPGSTLTIDAWTNQSGVPFSSGVGVDESFLPSSDGPSCMMTLSGTGFFTCTITLNAQLPCATQTCTTSISLSTTGIGVNDATVTIAPVTIQTYTMVISAITVSVAGGGNPDNVPSGGSVTLSITVTSAATSAGLSGATVTFDFSSPLPTVGSSATATTSSSGVATLTITGPTGLTNVEWFNVTATVTLVDYASVTTTKAQVGTFAVWPPPTTNTNSNSNSFLDSPAVLGGIVAGALVVILVLVLVLRKRGAGKPPADNAPQGWTGPAPPAGQEPPPGVAQGPPQ